MQYYREPNGDYLAVHTRERNGWEGRATAIGGLATSVQTTGIGDAYLEKCTEIPKSEVPAEWLEAIGE